jgi:hypothetical protein
LDRPVDESSLHWSCTGLPFLADILTSSRRILNSLHRSWQANPN